jgi:deoxyribodipyrimidine photo-lyase
MQEKFLLWFRNDLRISDNPALSEATKNGSVLPVYIFDPEENIGAASKFWLHNSLKLLNESLQANLNVYFGNPKDVIFKLVKELNINYVYWNRLYDNKSIKRDSEIKLSLASSGIKCKSFSASLLWEPWDVLKSDKTPYKVYTHFYRNGCLKTSEPRYPIPKLQNLSLIKDPNNKTTINDLALLPKNEWYKKLTQNCLIGEKLALQKLNKFLSYGLKDYKEGRNYPAKENISNLSANLHFGEISPNQIWYAVKSLYPNQNIDNNADHFLSELGWREFSYYLLYHFPELPYKNFQNKFDKFSWHYDEDLLKKWQKGETGYPIIDAGMRELWETGFMHNRVRMIVASFLIKNLLIDWRYGSDWFWNCLTDADLANNSASWQWVAGSGADAAPYFRIFNPVLQGEKFDPDGSYTRKFVPEIAKLPNKFLFNPWLASSEILKKANIELGKDYPCPIIDLEFSRERALNAFKNIQ